MSQSNLGTSAPPRDGKVPYIRSTATVRYDAFRALLLDALERATSAAESQFTRTLPRNFGILRGSPRADGRRIGVEKALAELWLNEERFYLIVDVAVVEASVSTTWLWLRESGHPPGAFDKTWNQPMGAGPFKIMLPERIRDGDVETV
jgi:hypothetical protein